ncbi:hypothetical protein D3C79_931240 [compost metagenome]
MHVQTFLDKGELADTQIGHKELSGLFGDDQHIAPCQLQSWQSSQFAAAEHDSQGLRHCLQPGLQ